MRKIKNKGKETIKSRNLGHVKKDIHDAACYDPVVNTPLNPAMVHKWCNRLEMINNAFWTNENTSVY